MLYKKILYRFGSQNPARFYDYDVLNRAGSRNSPFKKKKRRLQQPETVNFGLDGLYSAASTVISTISGKI